VVLFYGGDTSPEKWSLKRVHFSGGVSVKSLRMGRTQEAFAQEVGTTRLQVTRWENGAAEPNRMAQRLPELLSEKVDGQATA
jgi:DNA-binding transcriptional regulator YiaG